MSVKVPLVSGELSRTALGKKDWTLTCAACDCEVVICEGERWECVLHSQQLALVGAHRCGHERELRRQTAVVRSRGSLQRAGRDKAVGSGGEERGTASEE